MPNWISWWNPKSGKRTSCSHLVNTGYKGRTECGLPVSSLIAPAGRLPRCKACLNSYDRTIKRR